MTRHQMFKDFIIYLRKLIKCDDEFITKADVARICIMMMHLLPGDLDPQKIVQEIEKEGG